MGTPVADNKTAPLVAFGLVVLGLLIAAVQGLLSGSVAGGLVAASGAIPACYGMWKGIQQETQGTLALSVFAVVVAVGVGGALIVLRFVDWLR